MQRFNSYKQKEDAEHSALSWAMAAASPQMEVSRNDYGSAQVLGNSTQQKESTWGSKKENLLSLLDYVHFKGSTCIKAFQHFLMYPCFLVGPALFRLLGRALCYCKAILIYIGLNPSLSPKERASRSLPKLWSEGWRPCSGWSQSCLWVRVTAWTPMLSNHLEPCFQSIPNTVANPRSRMFLLSGKLLMYPH